MPQMLSLFPKYKKRNRFSKKIEVKPMSLFKAAQKCKRDPNCKGFSRANEAKPKLITYMLII